MGKAQTFDIIAVSIPDSNVQMAVARIMVGADRYLSMQDALERVKTPPVPLFKNTELKDAEQHIAKLKALGVGFRVVQSDGAEADVMRADEFPDASAYIVTSDGKGGGKGKRAGGEQASSGIPNPDGDATDAMPPIVSVRDAISHHHSDPRGAAGADGHKGSGGRADMTGFGSAGGYGGVGGGYGMRADGLDGLRKSEAASRKKARLVSIITAAAVVALALLLYVVPRGNKFRVSRITLPATSGGAVVRQPKGGRGGATENNAAPAANANVPAPARPERQPVGENPRNSVNNRHKQLANSYVDSAKTGGDIDKQVAFYKIAISFNRYNLQAWHGLLQAYREMNKPEEARAAEAQMHEIFGDGVNSVDAAVTPFGEAIDAYADEGGVYRVEFKTKKTSREEILRDAFNLTRAVRNACNCRNISIYASTGPGGGLLVNSTAETPVHTLPEFSRLADINWVDD